VRPLAAAIRMSCRRGYARGDGPAGT